MSSTLRKCTAPENNGQPYHKHSTCTNYNRSWRGLKLDLEETKNIANLYCRCDDADDYGFCHNVEENAMIQLEDL